ncbi:hypothetical protein [Metabacillus mangrovi]|nr:hypothetical protein [Metabacillus mangrovi]
MSHQWMTPEQAELKKQRKQRFIMISIPIATIVLGALLTILTN